MGVSTRVSSVMSTSDHVTPTADGVTPAAAPRGQAPVEVWVDEGFAAFVRHRSARLARTALLLTADRHLAEDLLQTSLAKVAERWGEVAGRGDPTAYVRTVMLRTAIAWHRWRWRGEVPTALVPERAADQPADLADESLRLALVQLPPRQRAVLVLRFYEDLSEADTAAALGCSVGTVKSQTAKGLAKLRGLLERPTSPRDGDQP
ncbi:MAG: polymerase sigma24 factor [Ilumatobacteraceae bacterium]|nr:polymerase sigma24 factor [Ilumatobacteraceae bacterium]